MPPINFVNWEVEMNALQKIPPTEISEEGNNLSHMMMEIRK